MANDTTEPVPAQAPQAAVAADTAEDAPGNTGVACAEAADSDVLPPGVGADVRRRRRRRIALLGVLSSLLTVFALFTGWYLVNRKPVTALPLPGVTLVNIPHYAFSVYGVKAPTGVAVSPDGSRIYVTQTEGDPSVLIFDGQGNKVGVMKPPATIGGDHVPVYLAINPKTGEVYESDRPAGSIYVFSADGVYRRTFDPGTSLAGWQPIGMSFDSAGNFYVTNVGSPGQSLLKFGPDGSLLLTIGGDSGLNFPNGVAVDRNGYIYVTDSNNGRLLVFDATGARRALLPKGISAGDLGLPRGVVVDDSGRVYVADTTSDGVQLYHTLASEEPAPKYIGRFGVEGSDDGAFLFPNGVAVDARARIYVTDWRNNRLQVWSY